MFKIIGPPVRFKTVFDQFKDDFTKPSHKSMTQLAGAVIGMDKNRTVRRLHRMLSKKERKSRTAYEYFFNEARWDEDEVAQRKADLFFEASKVEKGDRLFLIIDDTYQEKKGDKTQGVGRFYDHSKNRWIEGNCFVTSALQAGEVYILHKAKMYLKEESAEEMGESFRTKIDIAYEDIVKPLAVPEGVMLYVIHDSWWYKKEFIMGARDSGHHIVCRLKSDKKVFWDGREISVKEFASELSGQYQRVEIKVRGKQKEYLAAECVVGLEGVGEVRAVVSKTGEDSVPKFYMTTDLELTLEGVLEIYENRWNIETAHREGNQKFGFKDYMIREKRAIERFMQLTFMAWAVIVIAKLRGDGDIHRVIGDLNLGGILEETQVEMMVETYLHYRTILTDISLSKEEKAERLIDLFME
ncbi:MAG: IS701 family transposase [Candidatus Hydrothermarchaeales archaeon]